jgi:3-oxoacyl-[acyl-carrier protein] reductase
MNDLSKSVLVLGGTGDIGRCILQRYQDAGFKTIGVGSNDFDLSDLESIDRWFAATQCKVDILIHSAGLNRPARFEDLTEEEILQSFQANVEGFLRVVRNLLPTFTSSSRIVVLSSIFGFLSRSGRLPYTMSKHALVGIVKALALELAPDGILVNSVSPGYIDTQLTRRNNDQETISVLESHVPLGRLGEPEEIADVVYFLGSDNNRYITGQDLVVDGGFSIDGGRV